MTLALPSESSIVCRRTGLALVAFPNELGYRTQKSSFGPLNPQQRPESPKKSKVKKWGRWDVAGHRTVYAAETPTGSYVESLAWARADPDDDVPLDKYFTEYEDGVPYTDDEPTLMAQINEEYRKTGKMCWGQIPADWRFGRCQYKLKLPPSGWFIDIGAAETVSTIAVKLDKRLKSLKVQAFSLHDVYGYGNRPVTTMIAHWLHGRVLFDGSRPHGIFYRSKYGNNFACHAIWLRQIDDGKTLDSEPTKCIGQTSIEATDADLIRAAGLLNLHVH